MRGRLALGPRADPHHAGALLLEAGAFLIHALVDGAVITNEMRVERFPWPFPFTLDPDHPGASHTDGLVSRGLAARAQ